MSNFIERLPSRVLCSATPGLAAVVAAIRGEVVAISQPVAIVQRTCPSETNQILKELQIFHTKGDGTLVTSLKTAYQGQLKILKSDIQAAKALYARGINRVVADAALVQRRPGDVGAADQLSYNEGLLTAQAATASSTLSADGNSLLKACAVDLAAITNAHAIDATLASDTAQFSSTLVTETGVLNSLTATIQNVDVPALIASA